MRWIRGKEGQVRYITKFLLLPKEIKGEVRWLERVTIKQHFSGRFWFDRKFIDER